MSKPKDYVIWVKRTKGDGPSASAVVISFIAKYKQNRAALPVTVEYVNPEAEKRLQAIGVKCLPTLVYKGKAHIDGWENIKKKLIPRTQAKESLGEGTTAPEEYIEKYMSSVINEGDDDDGGSGDALQRDEIQRRMSAFQKKRPVMEGVERTHHLSGGRKVVGKKQNKSYENDDEFIADSGVGDSDTPRDDYFTDTDGELLLENYRNQEADSFGRKRNDKPIRWQGY